MKRCLRWRYFGISSLCFGQAKDAPKTVTAILDGE